MIYMKLTSDRDMYYYRDARALPFLPEKAARFRLIEDIAPVRSQVNGENASTTVRLSMTALTTTLFSTPPLGAAALLLDEDGVEHFAGRVESVELAADGCTVGLEA